MWKIMTAFTVVIGLAFAGLFAWIIMRLVSQDIRREFLAL
jgi:HAMP domain-containing protein